jgi:predicted dehydrogenase
MNRAVQFAPGVPAAPAATSVPAATSAPPTRVAVVGTGAWWGRQHAQVFASRVDAELVAVVGRDPGRAAARAAEFGVPSYVDIEEMLEREQPDLVSLCLPNQGHFEPTLRVIRAGFPLLVEKPLVFECDEAEQLLAEADARRLFFAINFNHRYARPVRLAADAINRGELGSLVFATWRFGGEPGDGSHPHANLIETQCHGFDLLEHLCGPISSVTAQLTDLTGRGYSTVAVALAFASGAVGTLVGSYDSSYAYPGAHQLELNGTAGRVSISDTVRMFTLHLAGDEVGRTWQAGYFNDRDRDFHATFDRYVDDLLPALREGRPPPVPARAGHRALVLAHAVIRSYQTGIRVPTVD